MGNFLFLEWPVYKDAKIFGSAHEPVALIGVFRDNQSIDSPTYQGLFDRPNSITKQLGGFKKRVIHR